MTDITMIRRQVYVVLGALACQPDREITFHKLYWIVAEQGVAADFEHAINAARNKGLLTTKEGKLEDGTRTIVIRMTDR